MASMVLTIFSLSALNIPKYQRPTREASMVRSWKTPADPAGGMVFLPHMGPENITNLAGMVKVYKQ
jgi:hypothetical protein